VNLNKKISLEVFDEQDEVTYYTVLCDGEANSETIKFFSNFINKDNFKEDIDIISKRIDKIGSNGAEDRHFRREGTPRDDVGALPDNFYSSKLRLYAIHVSKNIVILGNGGHKTTKTYNNDPFLNDCVTLLQAIDKKLKNNLKYGKIKINNRKLVGTTTFNI